MSPIIYKKTQIIKAPIDKVFGTIIDIGNFPKWNPTTPQARKISRGKISQGSEFEMKVRGFGMVKQTLDEFENNKRVMIVPHIKVLGGGHRFILKKLVQIKHKLSTR